LNKADLLADGVLANGVLADALLSRFPQSLCLSAKTGKGLDELKCRIAEKLSGNVR
jgi:50S ribosomal subunit-associated GTPase HflX